MGKTDDGIGGLVGESTESNSLTITDSYNTGAITATIAAGSRQSYAGGLAGNVKYGTMQNCSNSGDVKSVNEFGAQPEAGGFRFGAVHVGAPFLLLCLVY